MWIVSPYFPNLGVSQLEGKFDKTKSLHLRKQAKIMLKLVLQNQVLIGNYSENDEFDDDIIILKKTIKDGSIAAGLFIATKTK